jgi:hypothetical protein
MALVDKSTLLARLSPPLNALLAEQLLAEFISLERRFVLRDWEPAELDGGQFAEALARALYHQDSGTLNLTKDFDECLKWIENPANQNLQQIKPHQPLLHLTKVLRTIYKFRSQRGAVHISPTYSANELDSKFIIESVRWLMAETLRLFAQVTRDAAASMIREILQFDVPCVGKFEDVIMVQRTDLSSEEEILVLLHYAGDQGFTRRELGQYARCSAASVTRMLQKLEAPNIRQVVAVSDRFRVTDLGSKRIRESLSSKLLLE